MKFKKKPKTSDAPDLCLKYEEFKVHFVNYGYGVTDNDLRNYFRDESYEHRETLGSNKF